MLALGSMSPVGAHGQDRSQRADVLEQGEGGTYQNNGARLTRGRDGLEVSWRVSTPTPGSYAYPSPDQVPPGAPIHPPIEPGHPEVFTLWAFVFNSPDACTDPCNLDDVGDTPAGGGIYQLDGVIANSPRIRMDGKIRLGQPPLAGVPLQELSGAEVHIAMAPHGKARSGNELGQQLNSSVGTPDHWWPAFFLGV